MISMEPVITGGDPNPLIEVPKEQAISMTIVCSCGCANAISFASDTRWIILTCQGCRGEIRLDRYSRTGGWDMITTFCEANQ